MPGVSRATRFVMPKPHSGRRSSDRQSMGSGTSSGFEEQLPEPVRVAGEVVTGLCGADAGIDAHEEHSNPGLDAVAKGHAYRTRGARTVTSGRFTPTSIVFGGIRVFGRA